MIAAFETVRSFFTSVPHERLYVVWGAAGVVLWFALVGWYVREPRLVARWSRPLYLCVTLFPALAIAALTSGFYAGKNGTRLYSPPADVQIWIKGQASPVASRVLFVLDDFFVLRGHAGTHAQHQHEPVGRLTGVPSREFGAGRGLC